MKTSPATWWAKETERKLQLTARVLISRTPQKIHTHTQLQQPAIGEGGGELKFKCTISRSNNGNSSGSSKKWLKIAVNTWRHKKWHWSMLYIFKQLPHNASLAPISVPATPPCPATSYSYSYYSTSTFLHAGNIRVALLAHYQLRASSIKGLAGVKNPQREHVSRWVCVWVLVCVSVSVYLCVCVRVEVCMGGACLFYLYW